VRRSINKNIHHHGKKGQQGSSDPGVYRTQDQW
jgi:hypothetical protein